MHADEMSPDFSVTDNPNQLAGPESENVQNPAVMISRMRLSLWFVTLGIGLIAGLASWAGGEALLNLFRVEDAIVYPSNYKQISGYQKQNVTAQIQGDAIRVVERRRATASFGLLGLLLGGGLGLAGALAGGPTRTALSGAAGGGTGGVVAGAGLSYVVVPLFFRYLDPEQGLLILFFTHAAIFAGVGAASGLGLALGLGDRSKLSGSVFGGMLGALIGTFAFEAINSLAFPLMRTYEPISTEWFPRLLVYTCVATGTALLAGLAAGGSPKKSASATIG